MWVVVGKRLLFAPLYVLLVCEIAGPVQAQPPSAAPRFEVVSVKPCPDHAEPLPGDRKGDARESSPNRMHLPCQTLMSMIQWAYGNFAEARFNAVASVPISGGPKWINTERFQIDAKSELAQKSGTMNGPMLRAVLEERFHLVIRREVKEVSVYSLTIAKGSVPTMPHSTAKCITLDSERPLPVEPGRPLPVFCGMSHNSDKGYDAFGVTMARFAALLSDYADRRVVDRTGLSGEFDIHLNLSLSDLGHPAMNASDDDARLARDPAEIFARVRAEVRKLGLQLEPTKGSAESLFVESAERPSAS